MAQPSIKSKNATDAIETVGNAFARDFSRPIRSINLPERMPIGYLPASR